MAGNKNISFSVMDVREESSNSFFLRANFSLNIKNSYGVVLKMAAVRSIDLEFKPYPSECKPVYEHRRITVQSLSGSYFATFLVHNFPIENYIVYYSKNTIEIVIV